MSFAVEGLLKLFVNERPGRRGHGRRTEMGEGVHAAREHPVGYVDAGGRQTLGVQAALTAERVVLGGYYEGGRQAGEIGG